MRLVRSIKEKNLESEIETIPLILLYNLILFSIKEKNLESEIETCNAPCARNSVACDQREESRVRD